METKKISNLAQAELDYKPICVQITILEKNQREFDSLLTYNMEYVPGSVIEFSKHGEGAHRTFTIKFDNPFALYHFGCQWADRKRKK